MKGKKIKRKFKKDNNEIQSHKRNFLEKSDKDETNEIGNQEVDSVKIKGNNNGNNISNNINIIQEPIIYNNQIAPTKKKRRLSKPKSKLGVVLEENKKGEVNKEAELKLPFQGKEMQCPFCFEMITTEVTKNFIFSSFCSTVSFFICLMMANLLSRGNSTNDGCICLDEPCCTCSCCHEFIHTCPKCKKVIGTRPPTSLCCL